MGREPRRSRRIHRLSVQDDVDRELDHHLGLRARELRERGWGESESRAEAARLFGDRSTVAAACREEARLLRRRRDRASTLRAWAKDLQLAARSLARTPGFTLLAVVTLALGIGANTAVFSVLSGVLLRQPPYPDPERLVVLREVNDAGRELAVARPNLEDWKRLAGSFEALAALPVGSSRTTVFGGTEPVRSTVSMVDGEFFGIMGVAADRGRTFGPDDSHPGAAPVVVVSHGFWRDVLGAPASLDGVAIRGLGLTVDVVGVMPPQFDYPYGTDVWAPRGLLDDTTARDAHNLAVVGRVRSDVPLAEARGEMSALAARLRAEYGPEANDAVDVAVRPLREERARGSSRPLALLMGAAALVLLIACANLAGALLARGTHRVREAAVRAALGGGRARIARYLLTENVLLAVAGGALGVLAGALLIRLVLGIDPTALPAGTLVELDRGVLGFALVLALTTTLLFGVGPALRLSRTPPATLLRSGDRGSSGRGGPWRLLIGAEVALALVLLVGTGLLLRSFVRITAVDPGFDTSDVLTAALSLPAEAYPDEARVSAVLRDLKRELEGRAGVVRVGGAHELPLATGGIDGAMEVEGRPEYGYSEYRVVLPGYFEALDIPVLEGRAFDARDRYDAPHVAVVNRSLAQEYWPEASPIGRRIRGTTNDRYIHDWLTVVGVVEDIRHASVLATPQPELYVNAIQRPNRASVITLVIETSGPAAAVAPLVRETIARVAPETPVELTPYADIAARDTADRRFVLVVISVFAAIALLLSGVGIYGVVAYTVGRRTRELGIRVALGGDPGRVVRAVQSRTLVGAGAGIVVGALAALLLTRLLRGLLYDVQPLDLPTFLAAPVVLLGAAWLASWLPARRITRMDPLDALRSE